VPVYVNKVGPYANPHETYHYYQLPVCRPDKVVHKSLSLGQVLEGDRIAESLYEIEYQSMSLSFLVCSRLLMFTESFESKSLCGNKTLTPEEVQQLVTAIEENYYAELIIGICLVLFAISD
jgi:transmembrane 9 superfamily protein 1